MENFKTKEAVQEDIWIPSACNMCYGGCSIVAHRVNGVVVKIEGNPNSPINYGKLCPKGIAGIMTLYDPHRVNYPLRRTNPEKGMGIDPKWKEISWEEALEEITQRLKKISQEDPRKCFFQGTTTSTNTMLIGFAFMLAFGSPNAWVAGGGLHCGNGAHLLNGLMHASWSLVPDYEYCNYSIYFGCSKGHGAGHVATGNAVKAADARARGMKLIVIDPMCSSAAKKATEWIPIRVGTDAALALSMVNVLLNELAIYDVGHIKEYTNGPYLIKPDGYYMRDTKTGKPLVWDPIGEKAKPYDDPSLKDLAIEGTYKVRKVECTPGFQLLKDHVKKYSPEEASKITTVPAPTIRRIAKEFGEEARIGSKIVIQGKEFPYRPVSAIYFRGAQGHKNSTYNCLSVELLNQVLGAADVAGGALGFNPTCFGHPETGKPFFIPKEGLDGLMVTGIWMIPHLPYPPHEPTAPDSMGFRELFPFGLISPLFASSDQETLWQKFKLPYRPEIMINFGCNSIMSVGNAQTVAETLKKIPFIVSFDLFLNEFTDFADIVLPDVCYLERLDAAPNHPFIFNHPAGLGEWAWPIRQPTVKPDYARRSFSAVMMELAERVGIKEDLYATFNLFYDLKDPYRLDPSKKYQWEDLCDTVLKNYFGPESGLEWFKREGLIKWSKKAEEVYWRPFVKARVPIYYEFIKKIGEQAGKIAEEFDFHHDFSRYNVLPDWFPCPSHEVKSEEYDLYGFYYRDVLHTNSFTMENPWLDEAAQMDPHTYNISINLEIAKKKGIKDGDIIWIESTKGRRIKGKAKLTEGIHPEGLGIAGCAGHWSKDQPIAKDKGVFFNDLLEIDMEHTDPIDMNLDLCVKVKVYKA